MRNREQHLDLSDVRARLEGARGRGYWRALEEAADLPEVREMIEREFPVGASEWESGPGRRQFLGLIAASLGLAGLTACTRQPTETIMPYVRPPEEAIPGIPLSYATAVPQSDGLLQGVLVESHLGRPTKVEGNPDHPASLGSTTVQSQAAVLGLYDPDRSQNVAVRGEIGTWGDFQIEMAGLLAKYRADGGSRIRFLSGTIFSPSLSSQREEILAAFPNAKWVQYDPAGASGAVAGSALAFGAPVHCYAKLDSASVILAIDSDFLCYGGASTRYARDFIDGRRVRSGQRKMNRLYAVEPTPSSTGGRADHRFTLPASQIAEFTAALAARIGVPGYTGSAPKLPWFEPMARDLAAHQGQSAILVGDWQPPEVHAMAHQINAALGNAGATVFYTEPLAAYTGDAFASLRELSGEMNAGQVDLLVIVGGNPVFDAPGDLEFSASLRKVKTRVHLSQYDDETSYLCDWHIPEAHPFEYWSDGRAYDGIITILQPLIAPLFGGLSPHEFLAQFSSRPSRGSYQVVREFWNGKHPGADYEDWWAKSVHDGLIADSALPAATPSLKGRAIALPPARAGGLEVIFRPDPYIGDGRFGNNGWLQELPRPFTKLTWDNAVLVAPETAQKLELTPQHVVELQHNGRSVRGSVYLNPGQAAGSVALHLGFGHSRLGRAANGAGFNASVLRGFAAPWCDSGFELRKTEHEFPLASTQLHHTMEGRDIILTATLPEFEKNPRFAKQATEKENPLTLYKPYDYTGYAWGMSIDLTACVNCSACVVACQAENNIAVVGKQQVLARRAMHWIRIDNYYKGTADNPSMHAQPLPCMQCEDAPCEVVCPTQATNHSSEGINDMVYNRCVGTRYCSNNCPYKVRRFNFFLYSDWNTESFKLQRNPDVTVRSRGVMEKCTYCIQRISEAHIDADKESRSIRDGEIQTACQQACPTRAIIFGNVNDKQSEVARLKAEPTDYSLLADLNTRPRTTYLADIRNPNPEIPA